MAEEGKEWDEGRRGHRHQEEGEGRQPHQQEGVGGQLHHPPDNASSLGEKHQIPNLRNHFPPRKPSFLGSSQVRGKVLNPRPRRNQNCPAGVFFSVFRIYKR